MAARLDAIIDMRHELVKLSVLVDWEGLSEDLSVHYAAHIGRPGAPIRCRLAR